MVIPETAALSPLEGLARLPDAERRIGPFQLVRQLGRGGFAPVWLAKEIYGGAELRTAAVKLFSLTSSGDPGRVGVSEARRRRSKIVDEARALCQLEHPSIVRFYAFATDEARGLIGLAMEYAAGTPLDKRLAEGGPLNVVEALTVGSMIASALSAVHRAGLVHRDVKPSNIIEQGGAYKLIDFGIAAVGDAAGPPPSEELRVVLFDDLPLEVAGTSIEGLEAAVPLTRDPGAATKWTEAGLTGTIGYIDPECVATGAPAVAASDLYSLGATLFEALTGRIPAAAAAARGRGVDGAVLDGRKPSPPLLEILPEAPPGLARIVDMLLAPARRDRPRSAEWVANELDRLKGALAGLTRDLPPEELGPFRGLQRFEESDRDIYFGRAGEIASAIDMLRGHGVVALVGASGSGKSSLARAGVLPRAAEGALGGWPRAWDTAIATPGRDPRAAILEALAPFVEHLAKSSPEAVVEALAQRAESNDRGLILLVDQLEELATMAEGESRAFAAQLLAILGEQRIPGVRAMVTVRRDLLDPLLGIGGLGKALVRGSLLVSPMSDAAWEDVIDQALSAYGYALEDEALREELLRQLAGTAGAMPLVQFALTELWHKRDKAHKKITREGLNAIGGIAGALERHADATLAGFLAPGAGAERTAKRVLLALTTPQGTRALLKSEEAPRLGEGAAELIQTLEEARLVTREPSGVTLAHEALLGQWSRLREWVAEAREDRLLVEELERDAGRWKADADGVRLWTRRRLEAAEDLVRRGAAVISIDAAHFVKASRRAERRVRLAIAAAAVGLLSAVGLVGALYVRSIEAEQRRTDQALTEARENLSLAEAKTREVEQAQGRITELLRELAEAPDKEALLSLQQKVKEISGEDEAKARRALPGGSTAAAPKSAGPGPSPAQPPKPPGAPAPPPAPTATSIKLQTDWQ